MLNERQLRKQTEIRTMRILEVNMDEGFISGQDNFGSSLRISLHLTDPIISIPTIGEVWTIKRNGVDWFLDKQADITQQDLTTLSPGDKWIKTSETLRLDGLNVLINGKLPGSNLPDVTSTAHGLAPISPGNAGLYLNGAATPSYTAVTDVQLSTSDVTTNNVNASKHGFAPKAPNDATKYLDGTGAYSIPSASESYATTLPASPTNGQLATLVDSTTTPTYEWRFRYNSSSSSSFKWEFIGGSPAISGPSGSMTTTTTGFTDLTSGPSITVSRSGDYDVSFGITGNCSTFTTVYFAQFEASFSGSVSPTFELGCPIQWAKSSMAGYYRCTSRLTSHVVNLKCQNDRAGGGTTTWNLGWIEVTPVRVS